MTIIKSSVLPELNYDVCFTTLKEHTGHDIDKESYVKGLLCAFVHNSGHKGPVKATYSEGLSSSKLVSLSEETLDTLQYCAPAVDVAIDNNDLDTTRELLDMCKIDSQSFILAVAMSFNRRSSMPTREWID